MTAGPCYIFITHDLPIVRHFADRIIVMKSGEIVEHATTEEIFPTPTCLYASAHQCDSEPKWQTAADAA